MTWPGYDAWKASEYVKEQERTRRRVQRQRAESEAASTSEPSTSDDAPIGPNGGAG